MDKKINVSASDGGQAAARDINENTTARVDVGSISSGTNIISNRGEVKVQIGAPRAHRTARRKKESELQAEFAQRTGIWCPKPAREWLEWLMERQQFTAHELFISWKACSIGWNPHDGQPRIVTPRLEAPCAYVVTAISGLYLLLVAWSCFWGAGSGSRWSVMIGCSTIGIFGLMCWFVNNQLLWPRRIALRVRQAMQKTG